RELSKQADRLCVHGTGRHRGEAVADVGSAARRCILLNRARLPVGFGNQAEEASAETGPLRSGSPFSNQNCLGVWAGALSLCAAYRAAPMPRTSQKRDRRSISTFGRITSPAMLLGVMSARRCTTSGVTIADLRSGGDAVS